MTDDQAAKNDMLFEVLTPLGFRVRVTRSYWELIITVKHPAMAGHENDVKDALENQERDSAKSKRPRRLFVLQTGTHRAMGLCSCKAA